MLTACLFKSRSAELFQEKMSQLFLNDKLSDVTFVIGDTKLPAHRFPLVVHSEYFENLLADTKNDADNNEIEIKDTSLEHFKLILEYIYHGSLEFNKLSVEDLFKVVEAAETYKLSRLIEFLDEHLATRVDADTFWSIVDNAISHSLKKTATSCMSHVELNTKAVVTHKLFEQLSPAAMERILKLPSSAPEERIFKALINWIRAHREEHSTKVVPLLKLVKFNQLSREDLMLLVRPDQLITDKDFVDLLHEHPQSNVTLDWSRAACETGAELTKGLSFGHGLFHDTIIRGVKKEDGFKIFIDLRQQLFFNCVKMVLKQVGPYTVSVSTDNANWKLVIDRSKYDCRGMQELYFTEQQARYISINAASSTISNDTFEVSHFEVLSTPKRFRIDADTTLLIPKEDVASFAKYAKIVKNQNDTSQSCPMAQPHPNRTGGVIIGSPQPPSTKAVISTEENQLKKDRNNSVTLLLPQPYLINALQLYSSIGLSAWHVVELQLSSNNKEWATFSCLNWATEKQTSRQPVMSIRCTGTLDTIELIEKYYLEGRSATAKSEVK
uniref:BTB domain-containing protein n=1 Tax=Panagrellus redivivus TaxID=6233 RepID=A0A7E4ZR65_PANRE